MQTRSAQSTEGGRLTYPGMGLLEILAHAILSLLFVRRDIVLNGELYLRRWYLKGRGTSSQWFLHNIRRPDAGRELHDHPWDFATLILRGGYVEELPGVPSSHLMPRQLLAGILIAHMAEHTHRLAHVMPGTWTFVVANGARRTWGFRDVETGLWRSWREYLGTPDAAEWPEDEVRS